MTGKTWALAQRHTPSRQCESCVFGRRKPAFAKFVEEAWEERTSGRAPHVTRSALHAKVVELFQYPLTDGALRGHLERCVGKA